MSATLVMPTIGDAVTRVAARLAAAGIADARREARALVALALEAPPEIIIGYPERPLSAAAPVLLDALAARRAAREPISRLAGRREFWSLDFAISPATLDPRPDSETLIEAALEHLPDRARAYRVLDFGCGSGCLLLALLSELPNATGIGVDLSPGAAAVSRRNAAALAMERRAAFAVGRWGEAIFGEADVILANPPYIPSREIAELAPEVALYEPRLALDGGPDGLAAYRALAPAARRLLACGGAALFEVGEGQAAAAAAILAQAELRLIAVKRDLAGFERCVVVGREQTMLRHVKEVGVS